MKCLVFRLDLQYIGFLLLIPRALSLLLLLLGWASMTWNTRTVCGNFRVRVCTQNVSTIFPHEPSQDWSICPSIAPDRIVSWFGSVCVFNWIFVLGTQFSLFNILSDIGVPFYRITGSIMKSPKRKIFAIKVC